MTIYRYRIVKPQPSEGWPDRIIRCDWYHPAKVDRNGEEYPGRKVYGFANENQGWVSPLGGPGKSLPYRGRVFTIKKVHARRCYAKPWMWAYKMETSE